MQFIKLFESFWGDEASGILPICKTTGRILIGKRSSWVLEPHTWGNFGGAIGLNHNGNQEEKLSPKDNAIKEFQEETGYLGNIEMIPSYIFNIGNFSYYNFIGLTDSEFNHDSSNIEHEEVSEIKWLTLDEVLNHEDLHFGLKSLLDNNLHQIQKVINSL